MWQPTAGALQLTQFTTVSGYVRAGILTGPSYIALFDVALAWVAVFVALFACEGGTRCAAVSQTAAGTIVRATSVPATYAHIM